MADFNPLNELPDPKSFQGNNMGGTFMLPGFFQASQQREQAAAPFIQMAQEAERQKIDQARQMNPLLVQHQQGANTTQDLTNTRFGQSTPHVVRGLELGNIKAGLENDSAGMKNAVEGAGLPGAIKAVQEKDLNEARARFASMAKDLHGKPGMTKVADYMASASAIRDQINDPEHRRQFEEEFMKDPTRGMQALTARASGIYNTAGAQQAKDVADIGAKASVEGHRLSANATIEAARIHKEATIEAAKQALDHPKNAAVMVLNARAWLANPPANAKPEDFAQRQGIVDGVEHAEATKLYGQYQANPMAGMRDKETMGRQKTYQDFLNEVKNSYKQTGGPRPGPTPEAARNLNVGGGGVTSSGAKFTVEQTP
jgi:hypothetical protein